MKKVNCCLSQGMLGYSGKMQEQDAAGGTARLPASRKSKWCPSKLNVVWVRFGHLPEAIHSSVNASGGLQVASWCLAPDRLTKAAHLSLSVLGSAKTEALASLTVRLEEGRSVEALLLVEGASPVAVNTGLTTQQKEENAEKAQRMNSEHILSPGTASAWKQAQQGCHHSKTAQRKAEDALSACRAAMSCHAADALVVVHWLLAV